MKRFLLANLLTIVFHITCQACAWEGTHNYYMFHSWSAPEDRLNISSRVEKFWCNYMNDPDCSYTYQHDEIMEAAKKKGDAELIAYMKALDSYIEISDEINNDSWDYPTKEQIEQRAAKERALLNLVRQYKGTRLRAQYSLLEMRANMVQKNHQANKTLWEKVASNYPASVYRDMMENIYAGALFHLGEREKAADIFARHGDAASIQWALRKYRNLAGIQKIYNDNPNSASLYYLLDEFVNGLQETLDSEGNEEWIKEVGRAPLYKEEALRFITFASQVIADGNTKDPCAWMTACGMVHYLLGMQKEAESDMAFANGYEGTKRSKDVRRCINLLVMTGNPNANPEKLASELKWLRSAAETQFDETETDDYFIHAEERVILIGLAGYYYNHGNKYMTAAVMGMYDNMSIEHSVSNIRSPKFDANEGYAWNSDYNGEYFAFINDFTADEMAEYFNFLKQPHTEPAERFIISNVYSDPNYFNDLIGTKYIDENKFEKAMPYLNQVSLEFLNTQNISYYMAHRDFRTERWIKNQRNDEDKEGPFMGKVTANQKLQFCEEMIALQKSYQTEKNGNKRCEIAYKLATRYFQASPYGNCWYLTDYGNSSYIHAESTAYSFAEIAKDYLKSSKMSTDFDMRQRSLYALAYMPMDPWCEEEMHWNGNDYTYTYVPLPNSEQYAALDELSAFAAKNRSRLAPYVTKCDVLKQFRKYQ